MAGYLDPKKLTPGVIDGCAKHAFFTGACGALAIALHDATGWPIVAITDHHNVYNGRAGGGSALHWTVRRPRDGKLIDVDGAHDPDRLLEAYHAEADDEQAGLGVSTRADAVEWYQEGSGSCIPLSLAATFVDAVLALPDRVYDADADEEAEPDAAGPGCR